MAETTIDSKILSETLKDMKKDLDGVGQQIEILAKVIHPEAETKDKDYIVNISHASDADG